MQALLSMQQLLCDQLATCITTRQKKLTALLLSGNKIMQLQNKSGMQGVSKRRGEGGHLQDGGGRAMLWKHRGKGQRGKGGVGGGGQELLSASAWRDTGGRYHSVKKEKAFGSCTCGEETK